MLAREKWNHAFARHVAPEIRDQVPEVVLLLGAHGAVGETHAHVLACEAPDRVVHVNPRVHSFGGRELGARRAQLDADDVARAAQFLQQMHAYLGARHGAMASAFMGLLTSLS